MGEVEAKDYRIAHLELQLLELRAIIRSQNEREDSIRTRHAEELASRDKGIRSIGKKYKQHQALAARYSLALRRVMKMAQEASGVSGIDRDDDLMAFLKIAEFADHALHRKDSALEAFDDIDEVKTSFVPAHRGKFSRIENPERVPMIVPSTFAPRHPTEVRPVEVEVELVERPEHATTLGGTPVGPHAEILPSGQQKDYLVPAPEERAKGFVEPVRRSYVHVGPRGPHFPLRDLTPAEKEMGLRSGMAYAKFETYPDAHKRGVLGSFWTQKALDAAENFHCGATTTCAEEIAQTYARNPEFYSGTFCCRCRDHFPVSEFVWKGTEQRVGTRAASGEGR